MADPADTTGRLLTVGEIGVLRGVFGASIPYEKVRIFKHRWFWPLPNNRAMTPNGSIYFPGRSYFSDFSAASTPLYDKGVFVHESTHLYQWYAMGTPLWMVAPLDRNYDYRLVPGQPFRKYDIEQMAMIAQHWYVLSHGGRPRDLPDQSYTAASYAALLPVR